MNVIHRKRRGLAVLIAVVMLAAVNVVVISSLSGSAADTSIASFRADTVRAFYATESGGIAVIKTTQAATTRPTIGTSYSVGSGSFTVTAMPAVGVSGNVNISGTFGAAARRLRIQVQ